jgi:hypothetical protein
VDSTQFSLVAPLPPASFAVSQKADVAPAVHISKFSRQRFVSQKRSFLRTASVTAKSAGKWAKTLLETHS